MSRLPATRAWLIVSLAVLALSAVAPGAVRAVESVTSFNLRYGDSCIGGTAAPGAQLSISWRDGAGRKKAAQQVESGSGIWMVCGKANKELSAGDVITANDGEFTREYTVPDLSVSADRVADVFHGTGPSEADIVVSYPLSAQDPFVVEHSGKLRGIVYGSVNDSKGDFTADFANRPPQPGLNKADIRSGDLVSVSCVQKTGDSVAILFIVP